MSKEVRLKKCPYCKVTFRKPRTWCLVCLFDFNIPVEQQGKRYQNWTSTGVVAKGTSADGTFRKK